MRSLAATQSAARPGERASELDDKLSATRPVPCVSATTLNVNKMDAWTVFCVELRLAPAAYLLFQASSRVAKYIISACKNASS